MRELLRRVAGAAVLCLAVLPCVANADEAAGHAAAGGLMGHAAGTHGPVQYRQLKIYVKLFFLLVKLPNAPARGNRGTQSLGRPECPRETVAGGRTDRSEDVEVLGLRMVDNEGRG